MIEFCANDIEVIDSKPAEAGNDCHWICCPHDCGRVPERSWYESSMLVRVRSLICGT